MPEQITEVINTNVQYNKEDEQTIVGAVVKPFDKWWDDFQTNRTLWDKLENLLDVTADEIAYENTFTEVYDNKIVSENKVQVKKLRDADILQLYNSAVAHTFNSNFKTPSQMIDVQLENELNDSEKAQQAYIQKAMLLDIWKKAGGKKQARKAVENLYKKGEMIFYVNWQQIFQNVRRKKEPISTKMVDLVARYFPNLDTKQIKDLIKRMTGDKPKQWEVSRQLKYDGANIKCINPENFVFDTTRADDFENCPKIYKDYKTYQNIADNETFKKFLDKDSLKELDNILKNGSDKELFDIDEDDDFNTDKAVKDNMLEVLEYIGDIKINDTFYRNLRIVIVARKFVACFEYNPNIINPFVYCAPRLHKDTGRGVPALGFIIPYSEACEELLNKINKAIGLSINRCYLAPKGAIVGQNPVTEGGVIEVGDSIDIARIIPIDTSSGIPMSIQTLEYMEGKKEQAFGRFKNSSGDTTSQAKTATESKIIMSGQNTIDAYENGIIADEFIITTFEKIGEMMANFQEDEQPIRYKDNTGKEALGMVDDTVRQGSYVYCIGDSQAGIEKKANQEQFMLGLEKFSELAMSQGKRLSITEAINAFGAIHEIENPSKFIEDVPQSPPPPQPEPSQVKDILARFAIERLQVPDELKILFAQEIGLIPNQEEAPIEPSTAMYTDAPPVQDAGMAGSMPLLQDKNIQ